jgi:hypothetical protein
MKTINKQEEHKENREMKTLVSVLEDLIYRGYSENFRVTNAGLKGSIGNRVYQPTQVKVVDFYRFEGASDPADEAILYAIETTDGNKGTLVDAFGPSSDSKVTAFMQMVHEISKKVNRKEVK